MSHKKPHSDDHHSEHPQRRRPSPSTSSNYRVLRCFCGCSELSRDEIENFAMMSAAGLINNDRGRKLFTAFLKIGHRKDKSNVVQLLQCYDLCNQALQDNNNFKDYLEDLYEACPSYIWEEKLGEMTQDNLNEILEELKLECVNNIEDHNDFDRFRRELLRKIT